MAGGLEEALLLPAMVVSQEVSVIGEKTYYRVGCITASLDGIENLTYAEINVCDLTVVSCFERSRAYRPRKQIESRWLRQPGNEGVTNL